MSSSEDEESKEARRALSEQMRVRRGNPVARFQYQERAAQAVSLSQTADRERDRVKAANPIPKGNYTHRFGEPLFEGQYASYWGTDKQGSVEHHVVAKRMPAGYLAWELQTVPGPLAHFGQRETRLPESVASQLRSTGEKARWFYEETQNPKSFIATLNRDIQREVVKFL